jgi:hypothetical protein
MIDVLYCNPLSELQICCQSYTNKDRCEDPTRSCLFVSDGSIKELSINLLIQERRLGGKHVLTLAGVDFPNHSYRLIWRVFRLMITLNITLVITTSGRGKRGPVLWSD